RACGPRGAAGHRGRRRRRHGRALSPARQPARAAAAAVDRYRPGGRHRRPGAPAPALPEPAPPRVRPPPPAPPPARPLPPRPRVRSVGNQGTGIGLPALNGSRLSFDVATVRLRAEALPLEEGQGRWGGNAGLEVEVPLGGHAALVLDGRYFRFQEQTLRWGRAEASSPVPGIPESLVDQIQQRL